MTVVFMTVATKFRITFVTVTCDTWANTRAGGFLLHARL
jgi:hypothetical protein